MGIADLFKKKDLSEKELKEREYKKNIKIIKRKLFKNPTKFNEFLEDATKLMENAVKDGLMTEKEKDKILIQFGKDFDKVSRMISKASLR